MLSKPAALADSDLNVDKAAIERFLHYCHRRRYRKKAEVMQPGDVGDTLFYIIKGSVTVTVQDDEGREIILAYLNRGDFIGEMGLFFPTKQRGVCIRARAVSELAEISYQRLRQLAQNELKQEYPRLLYAIGRQLSQRLLHTSRQVTQLALMDVSGRVARTLLDLCQLPDAMSHPRGTQIHVSRQEISRIVGCSREMVGRVLKDMEAQELIEVHGMTMVIFHER